MKRRSASKVVRDLVGFSVTEGDTGTCKRCGEPIVAHFSDAKGKHVFWTHTTRKTHIGNPKLMFFTLGMGPAAKIGSILVHADEATASKGHPFDVVAIRSLIDDPEVQAFLGLLRKYALLPVKR